MRKLSQKAVFLGLASCIALTAISSVAAPPNLVAAFFVKGKVGLKWIKVEGVEEYVVYRKPSSGDYEEIARVNDDHYFDTTAAPGTTYEYKIGIAGPGGEEFSQPKTVTIPGQTGDFVPPQWVGARIDRGKVYLNWNPVPGAVAYNIYRSTTSGANYEVVGNTQASSHADNLNLEQGVTYYYVLTAMNVDFEETPYSEEQSIKFGMSKAERDELAAKQAAIHLEPLNLKILHELTEGEDGRPMNQPADVYSNSKGQIYVTDALNARVHCYDANGKRLFSFGTTATGTGNFEDGSLKQPFTIYVDNKDHVYVSDIGRHDIQVFAPDGKFIRKIAVEMEEGAEPLRANGVCQLDDNRMVIADTGNHRIMIIDMDGNILSKLGTRGGKPGEFVFPGEIERSASGELFVVDVINNRIQVFDQNLKFLREFGETGQGPGMFGRPGGIAVSPDGRVWVSDGMADMIQAFTPEGEVKSILGSVQDEWQFAAPRGIHFVGDRLYVVDRLKNKVIVFGLVG